MSPRASVFSNKRGVTLLPQTAVEILLGVAAVILAVVIFAMVYRLVFGGNATEDDAKLLADIIGEMADSDRQYEQRAVLLRLEDNWIVGYDTASDEQVITAWEGTTAGLAFSEQRKHDFTRPDNCKDKECICNGKEDVVEECFSIKREGTSWLYRQLGNSDEKRILPMHLVSDYKGFGSPMQKKTIPQDTIFPADQSSEYQSFVAAAALTDYVRITNLRTAGTTETEAVMPVLIEKRIIRASDGKEAIIITLLPDTAYARNRAFYMHLCPAGDSTEERCEGLTGWQSVNRFIEGETRRYCAAGFDGTCGLQELRECTDGRIVDEPCWCGNTVVTFGVCSKGVFTHIFCEGIRECRQYCLRDTSKTADGESYDHCIAAEAVICAENPCGIDDTCSVNIRNGEAQCRPADDAREKTLSNAVAVTETLLAQKLSSIAVKLDTKGKMLNGYTNAIIAGGDWIPGPVPKPTMCNGETCICLGDNEKALQCEIVQTDDTVELRFRHDLDEGIYLITLTEGSGIYNVDIAEETISCGTGGIRAASCGPGTKQDPADTTAGRCCILS